MDDPDDQLEPTRSGGNPLTDDEKKRILDLRNARPNGRPATYAEIARQVGRDRRTVKRVLVDAGIDERPHLTDSEKARIVELFNTRPDGRAPTFTQIARQVGRSPHSVRRALEEARVFKGQRARRRTVGEVNRILRLYQVQKGGRWLSTIEIGKIVNRSSAFVHGVVCAAGVARTRSEAMTVQLPQKVRYHIVRLCVEDRWSQPKIAAALNLKLSMVKKVISEVDLTDLRAREDSLLLALYRQGRSVREVARLTGRAVSRVDRLVHAADAVRPRLDATRLAMRRVEASNRIAAMDLRPLAALWLEGAETEDLASEYDLPPDMVWDAIAETLSRMTPAAARAALSPIVAAGCKRVCPFDCAQVCARQLVSGREPRSLAGIQV